MLLPDIGGVQLYEKVNTTPMPLLSKVFYQKSESSTGLQGPLLKQKAVCQLREGRTPAHSPFLSPKLFLLNYGTVAIEKN